MFGAMTAISPERCIGGRELTEPRLSPDGALLAYAVTAAGSSSLVLSRLDGSAPRQLTSYPQPRPGRGLGGGCWCWTPDSRAVVYSGADGNLWLQPVPGGQVRRLTDHGPDRTAQAPFVDATATYLVYVVDQAEVWLQLLDGGEEVRVDDGSADFCFDPFIADGVVLWQAWNVPDMPWDAARVERAVVRRRGDGAEPVTVERLEPIRPAGSVQQPQLLADGSLLSVRDDSGWNNVWCNDAPIIAESVEHAGPTWGLGQRTFVLSPDGGRMAFTRNEYGFGRLSVVDLATGAVRDIARGVHGQLSWQGTRLAAVRTGARTPTQVAVYDTDSWERAVIDIGPVSGWEAEPLAEPELVELAARDGATLHARLYRADEATDHLLCWLHGGPTDQWQVTFMPRLAYWRSRGWNVLVPDHRGSTGHGRDYQQAMRGRWGELDIADTIDVLAHAHSRGWGRAATTVLMGGSAGGFTVLGVLADPLPWAAAAVVSYPVTDLADLAERSHRFERHYTLTLVGPLPVDHDPSDPYAARSPVNFAGRIRTPLLMFHGDTDAVVPVEQSRALAARILEAGGFVELQVYEGEGHGFRQPVNQLDEYRRTGGFVAEHVG